MATPPKSDNLSDTDKSDATTRVDQSKEHKSIISLPFIPTDFSSFYTDRSIGGKLLFHTFFIISVFGISHFLLTTSFDSKINPTIQPLEKAYDTIYNSMALMDTSYINALQLGAIQSKLISLNQKKVSFRRSAVAYAKSNYSLVTLLPFLSILTGLLAFLIAKNGWDDADNHIKYYFLVFSFLTALVSVLPGIYNQDEGILWNVTNYNATSDLQERIINYVHTAPISNGDTLSFKEFYDMIAQEEKKIQDIQLHFSLVSGNTELLKLLKEP